MWVLVGGVVFCFEIIATGALLKLGGHMGQEFLKSCGEDEIPSKMKSACGRREALDRSSSNEVSSVPL